MTDAGGDARRVSAEVTHPGALGRGGGDVSIALLPTGSEEYWGVEFSCCNIIPSCQDMKTIAI